MEFCWVLQPRAVRKLVAPSFFPLSVAQVRYVAQEQPNAECSRDE
jgi:hypothetical protein